MIAYLYIIFMSSLFLEYHLVLTLQLGRREALLLWQQQQQRQRLIQQVASAGAIAAARIPLSVAEVGGSESTRRDSVNWSVPAATAPITSVIQDQVSQGMSTSDVLPSSEYDEQPPPQLLPRQQRENREQEEQQQQQQGAAFSTSLPPAYQPDEEWEQRVL
jgi:hypothetical protein